MKAMGTLTWFSDFAQNQRFLPSLSKNHWKFEINAHSATTTYFLLAIDCFNDVWPPVTKFSSCTARGSAHNSWQCPPPCPFGVLTELYTYSQFFLPWSWLYFRDQVSRNTMQHWLRKYKLFGIVLPAGKFQSLVQFPARLPNILRQPLLKGLQSSW